MLYGKQYLPSGNNQLFVRFAQLTRQAGQTARGPTQNTHTSLVFLLRHMWVRMRLLQLLAVSNFSSRKRMQRKYVGTRSPNICSAERHKQQTHSPPTGYPPPPPGSQFRHLFVSKGIFILHSVLVARLPAVPPISFPTSVRVRLKCGLHPVPLPGQRASDPGAGESKQGLVSSSPGTKPSRFGVLLDSGISKGGGGGEQNENALHE